MSYLGWTNPRAFDGETWTCPSCKQEFPEWQAELAGACGLNVFCPLCTAEFVPETGELHDHDKCEDCRDFWAGDDRVEPTGKQLELEMD